MALTALCLISVQSPVNGQSTQLIMQQPKQDNASPAKGSGHRLNAEIHEYWSYEEMGFRCNESDHKTVSSVAAGTQVSQKGLLPGDVILKTHQNGDSADIDFRRGNRVYRITIDARRTISKPHSEAETKTDSADYVLVFDSGYWSSPPNTIPGSPLESPLGWCKNQLKASGHASQFPPNLTFIDLHCGAPARVENCDFDRVKSIWLKEEGCTCAHNYGTCPCKQSLINPLNDEINKFIAKYPRHETSQHKLVMVIVAKHVGPDEEIPEQPQSGGSKCTVNLDYSAIMRLRPSELSITVLGLGDDLTVKNAKYVPFSSFKSVGLSAAISRALLGQEITKPSTPSKH
ncbi:MAG TPA: hypothetical protein V6C81_24730 [Planktothrix sp.]|jgi:hypothetical protein